MPRMNNIFLVVAHIFSWEANGAISAIATGYAWDAIYTIRSLIRERGNKSLENVRYNKIENTTTRVIIMSHT